MCNRKTFNVKSYSTTSLTEDQYAGTTKTSHLSVVYLQKRQVIITFGLKIWTDIGT